MNYFRVVIITFSIVFYQNHLHAQVNTRDSAIVKKDSVKSKAEDKKKIGVKPYAEVITAKAKSDDGFFTVHKVEDRYYFEIPDQMLKKDILLVTRLSKAGAGMRSGTSGYAGDQIGQNVIAFEKGPKDKMFIKSISFVDYAKDSTSDMYRSVSRNNVQPIMMAFDIKAYGKENKTSVIDITDMLNGEGELVSFAGNSKDAFRVGSYQKEMSYINSLRAFPGNIEINTTKTFSKSAGRAVGILKETLPKVRGNYTVEINSSFVLLPENKMQARYFDPRVGYFTVGYTDFDVDPQGVKDIRLIKRWRLEPKPEDLGRYKKGELVEPAKPIVFYIDPATPKKWVPYLIQGVNDWQKAFEKAGFKNAIYAKLPDPVKDKDWSLEDARYSAIVYKPSDVPNASGPSIADPRTGEILESHINWYHNVMLLLRNWYFIQAAPNDPRARKMEFDEALMGQLIRFVSSHEVGHTLGLRHNFGSSSTVPVEKLRDKKWVEANGHTPSIMDYARFNYVAQPEDRINEKGIMPRIGDYDEWAIDWGYRRFSAYPTPDSEREYLNKWVLSSLRDHPRLWFGTESNSLDPRSQSEQVGDNAMVANTYGIANLKRVMNNLPAWTATPNEDYKNLGDMYDQVLIQFRRYLGHVSKYIGGQMETPKTAEQSGAVYVPVAVSDQKEALEFLRKNIFETPQWLLQPFVFEKTGKSPIKTVESLQNSVLSRILSRMVLESMYTMEAVSGNSYPLAEYFNDITKAVFDDVTPDLYKRNLQRNYVSMMIALLDTKNRDNTDIRATVRGNLRLLKKNLLAKAGDNTQIGFHFEDLADRIDRALDPK